ncbi:hypothetical protein BJX61DRAFT_540489 [Aspergillus egyptiacus]|nr:hypothetical protein BJX61DRAFT_540489 [Aspergillus egyptiacus]
MSYKSNYEPYTSQSLSLDLNRHRTPEELLYPLEDLYPHVVAVQLQSYGGTGWTPKQFSGCEDFSYWAEVVSSPRSLPENYYYGAPESTRSSFVSRIRRLLSRDELRRRRALRVKSLQVDA